jgi:sulfide:quinone oxidoreductase
VARVLILGGGFGGVVAAERLAKDLGDQHEITLVSRNRQFVFYPALVRLAFGKCERDDVSFDLRHTMLNRRVNFIEAEVARINPDDRKVIIAHGEIEGQLPYDYLVFALGRRLATERVTGFFEHAHHLLNPDKALQFGKALAAFHRGRAVIGECPGARLPVPVYETAFALSRLLQDRGEQDQARITIVSPYPGSLQLDGSEANLTLHHSLAAHGIEFVPDFPINRVAPGVAMAANGNNLNFNLVMLVPPFQGPPAAAHLGITNEESYINVNSTMRVAGIERMYAVGDSVNLSGPKMGHMAVRQAEVAATNLIDEIEGREPSSQYVHEMRLVIDEGGGDSLYLRKELWLDEPATVRQGRFWSWAKLVQEKYWQAAHS